jgi:hypothetical protein
MKMIIFVIFTVFGMFFLVSNLTKSGRNIFKMKTMSMMGRMKRKTLGH